MVIGPAVCALRIVYMYLLVEKMRDGSMIVRRHAIIARHRMDQQSGETTDISVHA